MPNSKINNSKIESLVQRVREDYRLVPYHNFAHGVSVMQYFYKFIDMLGKDTLRFSDDHIFCCLIACLGHDLGHMGVNNMFHINNSTKLACKTNYKSALENFHAASLLKIISKEEFNIFD